MTRQRYFVVGISSSFFLNFFVAKRLLPFIEKTRQPRGVCHVVAAAFEWNLLDSIFVEICLEFSVKMREAYFQRRQVKYLQNAEALFFRQTFKKYCKFLLIKNISGKLIYQAFRQSIKNM